MEPGRSSVADALLAASPDAVVVVDDQGLIESASPAVEPLFGYHPGELIGQPVEALLPETLGQAHVGHRRRYANMPVARAMGANLDLLGRRKDGTVFPVDVSLAPTTEGGRLRIGAFVRDATMRRRTETLLHHVNEISRVALAGAEPQELFAFTAIGARSLLSAATAWVAVMPAGDPTELEVAAASGTAANEILGSTVAIATSIAARAMSDSIPITVADMSSDPNVIRPARECGLGPGLYVPMLAESGPVGALVVARDRGDHPFDTAEVAAAEGFAAAAAVVLALDRARQSVENLKILAGYERIARDLHDTVIQRLFALGMGLQATERMADQPVRERVSAAVEGIDEVIREIRETIFDLHHPTAAASPVRHELRQVISELTPLLGFDPRLAFRGPVESEVPPAMIPHLVAVVREALTNVARHARASAADVVAQAAHGRVTVTVNDDGIGMPGATIGAGHGLENMKRRAEHMGGTLTLTARSPSGTSLTWTALADPAPTGPGAGPPVRPAGEDPGRS